MIKKDKRGTASIHILVGVIILLGGLLYLFNQPGLGLVTTSVGLLIEAIINWVVKIVV